jgi:hypothetical protein
MGGAVYLHIGAPKSGTTYLQERLSRNARSLARHGIHVPSVSPLVSPARAQFRAALDLLGQDWGGPAGHARGYWPRLVEKVHRTDGAVVISHEILAPAPPDKIAQAMRDLQGREVHIVFTTRDLSRQLASAWPESIKNGYTWTYRRFLSRARRGRAWFWRAFELPRVLEAWGVELPGERLHVVTVPGDSSSRDPDLLWRRFCDALGAAPAWGPREASRSNPSLGAVDTQLLRWLNLRGGAGPDTEEHRDRYVDVLTRRGRVGTDRSSPVELPPSAYPWVREEAQRWADWLSARDISVHGDVRDLVPQPPSPDQAWVDPDRIPRRVVIDAALRTLDAMVTVELRASSRRDRIIARARESRAVARWL